MRSVIIGLLLFTTDGHAAGSSSYTCRITDFKIAGTRPELQEWVGATAMETTVDIDRQTGRVTHPVIGNTSFNHVTLLNKGSASWSFKAFADSGNGGHVRYYEVHEYDEGAAKSFLAVSDGIAFFGECS